MTRINTNVSSLTAQKTLQRSNMQLQEALTRLSTGLRINSGKDDPAGLIASEILRSDITSVETAISNSQRANQMIATADSALGQVSSLLNDVRGLVTEAANQGAMSEEQIAANQLQVDSSLEAINRIAQTTTFGGRRLLDGSLAFTIKTGAIFDSVVTDLQIDQANLGDTGSIAVSVDVTSAAEKAEIKNESAFSGIDTATTTFSFAASATVTLGTVDFDIRATSTDDSFDGATIDVVDGGAGAATTASYDDVGNTLTITYDVVAATTTAKAFADAINATGDIEAIIDPADEATVTTPAAAVGVGTLDQATLQLDATSDGAEFNHVSFRFQAAAGQGTTPKVTYDADIREMVIKVDDTVATDLVDIGTAVDGFLYEGAPLFASTVTLGGAAETLDPTATADIDIAADTGITGGAVLLDDLVVELSGLEGAEVFNFDKDASIDQVTSVINLVSDAMGVEATYDESKITFTSAQYGSDAFVGVEVLGEGDDGGFLSGLSERRDEGADIEALVNGFAAIGDGNSLSLNTAALDMTITVDEGSDTDFSFKIIGGGGLFQLGPDVVPNQQARLGITSVNTARLGGVSGRLYELASGESASLSNDPTKAAEILEEALNKVTSLRGRLGAFQRTTLETNIATLNDTLEALTEAESSIRDADFAAESARLTRAQILVQSGTSVLSIANSSPQNVLALLR